MSTGIFVDIARHFQSVSESYKKARVDYEKYLKTALNGEPLHRAIAYGVQIDNEANNFILALKNIGYEPKYKLAKIVNNEENIPRPNIKQTTWTIGLCMDVVRNINFLSHVIIGSNDPTLVDLILWIKEKGIKVTIYSINIPRELKMVADFSREIQRSILEIKESEDVAPSKGGESQN